MLHKLTKVRYFSRLAAVRQAPVCLLQCIEPFLVQVAAFVIQMEMKLEKTAIEAERPASFVSARHDALTIFNN